MTRRAAALLGASLLACAVAPWLGPSLPEDGGGFILWQLRVPRVLVAMIVGGTLSLVGAATQTIFANPLAAPSTVGTTAGATLGALVALVFGGSGQVSGLPVVTLAAFAGALAVSLTVAAIAARGRARVEDVLLAGIALSLAAGALASGLQFTADTASLARSVRWSLGHLAQVGYRGTVVLTAFALPSAVVLLAQSRALEALVGGERRAHSQGVDVPRLRVTVIAAGALGVAACVAWCGPIAFVGLIVPHLARLALGSSRRVMLPASLVLGAGFLVACDLLARLALPGRELPVGVVTATLGAPALAWLIAARRRERSD